MIPEIGSMEHYGQKVHVSTQAEALRRSDSLCYNCTKFQPGTAHHCEASEALFQHAQKWGLSMIITMCPSDMFVKAETNFHDKSDTEDFFGLEADKT